MGNSVEPSDVWPGVFDNPDKVGQSEYRAIYELVGDVLSSLTEGDVRKEHVLAVLSEVGAWAKTLEKRLAEEM